MPAPLGTTIVGNHIVPNSPETVNSEPTVGELRPHKSAFMANRKPLGVGQDELANRWEVMATFSTSKEDPKDTVVAAVVRDTGGNYSAIITGQEPIALEDRNGRGITVQGEGFMFTAGYDTLRDSLSVVPDPNLESRGGTPLIETMAMFAPPTKS